MRNDDFEEKIRKLTKPINGQLPRPWMTAMTNPLEADVFIVGKNQSREYSNKDVPHKRHMDALFNRNGQGCRELYDEVTENKPSRTRGNIDDFVSRLNQRDIHNILETNVICYSTKMSKNLRDKGYAAGAAQGEKIFRYLLNEISPEILIVHGVDAVRRVGAILKIPHLKVPGNSGDDCVVQTERHLVIPIPSMAPPAYDNLRWSSWRDECWDGIARRVREKLSSSE